MARTQLMPDTLSHKLFKKDQENKNKQLGIKKYLCIKLSIDHSSKCDSKNINHVEKKPITNIMHWFIQSVHFYEKQ